MPDVAAVAARELRDPRSLVVLEEPDDVALGHTFTLRGTRGLTEPMPRRRAESRGGGGVEDPRGPASPHGRRRARVGVLYRPSPDAADGTDLRATRLAPVLAALRASGVEADLLPYRDDEIAGIRSALGGVAGVLVWVDPISTGEDRRLLDALLREVSASGVWVSAHPDVVLRMGTKDVLYRTRELGWSGDVHRYGTFEALAEAFPPRLATSGARVLKQLRGNGGLGVWKVSLAGGAGRRDQVDIDAAVRVQHATVRDATVELTTLRAFLERCRGYFELSSTGARGVIDQEFQPRITEGLIRSYFVGDSLVGFSRQYAARSAGGSEADAGPDGVFGLPSAKTMFRADEPSLRTLRVRLEEEWLPGLTRLTGVGPGALPALWDADFLFGPRDADGADTYVLCEINVSSVTPFPETAPGPIATAVRRALGL